MPEEKDPRRPEVTFLPPLHMVLTSFDRALQDHETLPKAEEARKAAEGKTVEKLIEKLNGKEK